MPLNQMTLRQLWRWVIGDWWVVRRTIWPYADGWGTYNRARGAIADTGLPTREHAQDICDMENGRP